MHMVTGLRRHPRGRGWGRASGLPRELGIAVPYPSVYRPSACFFREGHHRACRTRGAFCGGIHRGGGVHWPAVPLLIRCSGTCLLSSWSPCWVSSSWLVRYFAGSPAAHHGHYPCIGGVGRGIIYGFALTRRTQQLSSGNPGFVGRHALEALIFIICIGQGALLAVTRGYFVLVGLPLEWWGERC